MQLFVSLLLAALSFGSPVHIHVQLAGNFGEPRPNHFHGGIDVKTERGVNFGIYSIADGYVSRAIVGEYGFGKHSSSHTPTAIPASMYTLTALLHRYRQL